MDQIKFGSLNWSGQSRPVEWETRWPWGQIRWPQVNGPVLTEFYIYTVSVTHIRWLLLDSSKEIQTSVSDVWTLEHISFSKPSNTIKVPIGCRSSHYLICNLIFVHAPPSTLSCLIIIWVFFWLKLLCSTYLRYYVTVLRCGKYTQKYFWLCIGFPPFLEHFMAHISFQIFMVQYTGKQFLKIHLLKTYMQFFSASNWLFNKTFF